MRKVIITVSALGMLPLLSQAVYAQKADSLKEKTIDEVVVIGYGSQKKAKVSGAVTTVKMDNLDSRSVYSIGEAMQGKAPGVVVMAEGGDPNSTARVNIRGLGGFNGDAPLYVIDGSAYPSGGTPNINPNDIESISILKDGSAAIYGARGSGGVVLITTKRGSRGMHIDVDAKMGISNVWKKIKPLSASEFQQVMATAFTNAGKQIPVAFNPNLYPEGAIDRTNWMNEIFQTGFLQEYNVAVSGGTEKSRTFMSLNYRDQSGTLLNTNSRRYNFHLNSDNTITSWLKGGASVNYNFTNGNSADTSSGYTGAIISALYYPPNIPVYDANGNYSGLPADRAKDYGDIINPVAYLKRIVYSAPKHDITVNPYIEATLFPHLTFRSNLAANMQFLDTNNFQVRVPEIGKSNDNNILTLTSDRTFHILAEQTLKYDAKFGLHSIVATAGYSFLKDTDQGLFVEKQNFPDEHSFMQYLQNGTDYTNNLPRSYKSAVALSSGLARIEYDYAGKYLLALYGRRDLTSMLAEGYRAKSYGTVSAGWVVSKENFFSGLSDWWNMFKIRGSYGSIGNLNSLNGNWVAPGMSFTTAYFGSPSTLASGYAQDNFANPFLKWATSVQKDIGADLGFFHNRLTIQADYFNKTTKDMIFPKNTPTIGSSRENYGSVEDKGFELGVNYDRRVSDRLRYSVYGTITTLQNKVLSMLNGSYHEQNSFRGALYPIWDYTGMPMYSFYGLKTDGIFQSQQQIDSYVDANGVKIQPGAKPGDLKFLKAPGNTGTINDVKDAQYLGNPYPKFNYSFGGSIKLGNFDMDVFFQGVQGNKIFNAFKYTTLNAYSPAGAVNLDSAVLGAWSATNPGGTIPRIVAGDPSNNFGRSSSFYIEDGSYLRLKTLTIGYSLPEEVISRLSLTKVRIYLTGTNLLTFTKYTGMDPEVGMDNGGMDTGRYPSPRSFIFGVTLGL